MTKTFLKSASALAVVLATSPAFANDPSNVEEFTTAVDAAGNPFVQGPTKESGRQLYVESGQVQVSTKHCNGILEVFYKETKTSKGELMGTFWGVDINPKDGVIVDDAGNKNDRAPMMPSGNYIAYEISRSNLGAQWQDVVSKNVDILRIVFPDKDNCNKPDAKPPTDTPELPGGGCKTTPAGCAMVDVNKITYDPKAQELLSNAYALNIG